MVETKEEDFDSAIQNCESNQEIIKICQSFIDKATRIITKDVISTIGEDDFDTVVIENFEKSLNKMLELGSSKDAMLDQVSPILENIQPGNKSFRKSKRFHPFQPIRFIISDLIDDLWSLKNLYHMKARMYVQFGRESEAIKVLKKWKKLDENHENLIVLHLIGYLYDHIGNAKEALKWYKKVLNEVPQLSISRLTSDESAEMVFMALFEIAKIKYQQKEYEIAKLILEEFCTTLDNHEDSFTGMYIFKSYLNHV